MLKKLLILALVASLKLNLAQAQDTAGDIAIVVGKSSSIDNLTSADLAKIFLAEKHKDADGYKIVIVMRETGAPERAVILAKVYEMGEDDYAKYFLQATFTGQVQGPPRELPGAAAMRDFVAKTPGALGYLKASDVDDSVKVVKVDGKSPGDADYKLKGK